MSGANQEEEGPEGPHLLLVCAPSAPYLIGRAKALPVFYGEEGLSSRSPDIELISERPSASPITMGRGFSPDTR